MENLFIPKFRNAPAFMTDTKTDEMPRVNQYGNFQLENDYVQRQTRNPFLYGKTLAQPKRVNPMNFGDPLHRPPPVDWRRLKAKELARTRYVNAPVDDSREFEGAEFRSTLDSKLFPLKGEKSLVQLARDYFEQFDKNRTNQMKTSPTKSIIDTAKSMGIYQEGDEKQTNPQVLTQIYQNRARLAQLEFPAIPDNGATNVRGEPEGAGGRFDALRLWRDEGFSDAQIRDALRQYRESIGESRRVDLRSISRDDVAGMNEILQRLPAIPPRPPLTRSST